MRRRPERTVPSEGSDLDAVPAHLRHYLRTDRAAFIAHFGEAEAERVQAAEDRRRAAITARHEAARARRATT